MLFHPDRDLVKVVNTTGLFIFDRLDGHTSLHELSLELAREFEVPIETAERDVSAFVEVLVGSGLAAETGDR